MVDMSRADEDNTVLFVDDEALLLDGLRDVLRKERYNIVTAVSGAMGLECLARTRVDVVVSDERMPGMSGSCTSLDHYSRFGEGSGLGFSCEVTF